MPISIREAILSYLHKNGFCENLMNQSLTFHKIFILISIIAIGFRSAVAYENMGEVNLPIDDLRGFSEVFNMIKRDFVEPIDDKTLLRNAIRGMLGGLDPHSVYLDPESLREINIDSQGEFGGLGLEVTINDGIITVIAPIDNSPAKKAGIQAGDQIVKLDGSPIDGKSLEDVIDLMRGPPGSKVTVTVLRENLESSLDITLKRAIIQLESVQGRLLDDEYGYIQISQFQAGTGSSLRRKIELLIDEIGKPLSGLVLDLRNNPGGTLEGAINVSDLFLTKGVIVSTRGRAPDSTQTFFAKGRDLLRGAPLVVLVNRGSASASEIVAGALQDHGRGLILGARTFGKGSVQTILPMKNGAGLKLTTARYFTPKNRSIQAKGIVPDIFSRSLELSSPTSNTGIVESDLSGHLTSDNEQNSSENDIYQDHSLLEKDLEIGEALNILKGMNHTRNQLIQG